MVPAHGIEQDFRCRAQVDSTVPVAPPSLQAPNNCRVLGNALTRVNIANRYLGNRASEYETEKWQAAAKLDCVNSTRRAAACKNNHAAVVPFNRQE